jgi:predicted metal-dependent HD superfamily phosphohydrolase
LWHRHLAHGGDPGDTVIAHAIAYHDAIYAVGANDNEVRSVNLWLAHAAALPATLREAVARAIMATADHPGRHPDAADQWLVDLDLTPLGEPWPLFAANSAALRAEAGLPHAAVTPKQAAFLRRLLDLPRIYRSRRGDDAIMHAYERTARGNLLRVLS